MWYAVTTQRGGADLPSGLAPWRAVRREAISTALKDAAAVALNDARVVRTIAVDGYYMIRDASAA